MQTYPCWHCKEKDKRIEELQSTLQQYLDNADTRMVQGFDFDSGEYPVTAETISILCAEKQQLQAKLAEYERRLQGLGDGDVR